MSQHGILQSAKSVTQGLDAIKNKHGKIIENMVHSTEVCRNEVVELKYAWLRDELGSIQKKLHECEQTNATYSVEIDHLKFLKDVQLFDINSET